MGTGYEIVCESCGNRDSFMLGFGMLWHPKEIMLERLRPRRREQVEAILASNLGADRDIQSRLYLCGHCGRPAVRMCVNVSDQTKVLYDSQFRCGKCRKPLVEADIQDVLDRPCWVCGRAALVEAGVILWD